MTENHTDVVLMPGSGLTVAEQESVAAALVAAKSPKTREDYAYAWRAFAVWCEAHVPQLEALPAKPETVIAYLVERANAGTLSSSGVAQTSAAIAHEHKRAGLEDPTAHPGVKEARAGLRRAHGTAPEKPAHPLSVEELRRIVAAIDTSTLVGLRDRAVLLVGYASVLRRSELSALRVRDLRWTSTGVELTIRKSKGDQEGKGQVVAIARGRHPETDPIEALHAWLSAVGALGRPECAVFCPITKSGIVRECQPITGESIGAIVIRRAHTAGLSSLALTAHSLRAGAITAAAEKGVTLAQLQRMARHASPTTTSRYVRGADAMRDAETLAHALDL
jgi:integrase